MPNEQAAMQHLGRLPDFLLMPVTAYVHEAMRAEPTKRIGHPVPLMDRWRLGMFGGVEANAHLF